MSYGEDSDAVSEVEVKLANGVDHGGSSDSEDNRSEEDLSVDSFQVDLTR